MNCINVNSKEFKELMEATGLSSFLLELEIIKHQNKYGEDSFPTVDDIKSNVSSEISNERKETNINNKITINEKDIKRYSEETIGESINEIQDSEVVLSSPDGRFDINDIYSNILTDELQEGKDNLQDKLQKERPIDNTSINKLGNISLREMWDNRQVYSRDELSVGLSNFVIRRLEYINSDYRRITEYIGKTKGNRNFLSLEIDNEDVGYTMATDENTIYINPFALLDISERFDSLDDLLKHIDSIIFEEVIHYTAMNIITDNDVNAIYEELSKKEIDRIKLLRKDITIKDDIVHEYLRMIVQDIMSGRISELDISTKKSTLSFINRLFNYLKDVFNNQPDTSIIKQRVNEVISIINKGRDTAVQDRYALDNIGFQREYEEINSSNPITNIEGGFTAEEFDSKAQDSLYASDHIIELIEKLSGQTDVEYTVISESDAQALIDNYNGEAAFFHEGQVYLVNGKFSMKSAFHEFSHPIVASMNNSTKNALFNKLRQSEEGRTVIEKVKKLYPEYREDSNEFIEEALVISLTDKALKHKTYSDSHKSFFKELLFQIRQLLRRVFGKTIDASKIDENTSLDKLGKILAEGGKFKVETERITTKKVTQFQREFNDLFVKDVQSLEHDNVMAYISNIYDTAQNQIKYIKNSKNLQEIADVLSDDLGSRGYLQDIRSNLSKYVYAVEEADDTIDQDKEAAQALAESIFKMEQVSIKIIEYMEEMTKNEESLNDKDNLLKTYQYNNMLKYWNGVVNDILEQANDNNIPLNNPLLNKLASMQQLFERAKKTSNLLNKYGLSSLIMEQILPSFEEIEKKYDDIISFHKKNKSRLKVLNKWHVEYYGLTVDELAEYNNLKEKSNKSLAERNRLKVLHKKTFDGVKMTDEKIQKILSGELGDANFANSFFEGYMYNTDPIVSGFASYVKNNMTDVINNSYTKYNDFIKEIKPLLDKIGYNPLKSNELLNNIAHIDTDGIVDIETGEVKEKKVWTFLSKHKEYRYSIKQLNKELNDAQLEFNNNRTTENKESLRSVKKKIRNFYKDYMYNEYVEDYYYRQDKYFSDEIGQEAYERYINARTELSAIQNDLDGDITNKEYQEKLSIANRKLQDLYYKYDKNGNLKDEKEVAIAERLIKYREENGKYYKRIQKTNVFQSSFIQFQQEFIDNNGSIYDEYNDVKDLKLSNLRRQFVEINGEKQVNGYIDKNNGKYYTNDEYNELSKRKSEYQLIEKKGEGFPLSKEYIKALEKWKSNNTEVKVKPIYFALKENNIQQIGEILSLLPDYLGKDDYKEFTLLLNKKYGEGLSDTEESRYNYLLKEGKEQTKVNQLYKEFYSLTSIYRDVNKQIDGRLMSDELLIKLKSIQEQIRDLSDKIENKQWLTPEDKRQLRIIEGKDSLKFKDRKIQSQLKRKKQEILLIELKKKLSELRKELYDLSEYYYTDNYYEVLNHQLQKIDDNKLSDIYSDVYNNDINAENIESFINNVDEFLKNEDFSEWFNKHHIKYKKVDNVKKEIDVKDENDFISPKEIEYETKEVEVYRPLNIWKKSKPADEKYYDTITIKDIEGNNITMDMPSNKYFFSTVKSQYRQKKVIGETIDNNGNWLPRTHEASVKPKDNRFINEEYYALKNAREGSYENDLFKILSKIKEFHHSNQKRLPRNKRLYNDLPRFNKPFREIAQADKKLKELSKSTGKDFPMITYLIQQIKRFVFKSADDVELGLNKQEKDFILAKSDMFDNEISDVHVAGVYNIDIESVSTDIFQSLTRYMFSAAKAEKIREMSPEAEALQGYLSSNKPAKEKSGKKIIDKFSFIKKGKINIIPQKDKYVREEAINNLISREFGYEKNKGWLSDNKIANNAMTLLFKRASFGFFALNIPSAMKNMIGPKYQAMVESAAGKHMSYRSMTEGEPWAFKAMSKLSFNLYGRDVKSLEEQMLDVFDAIQDRIIEKVPEYLSRNLVDDTINMSWLYNFRKWTESQATVSLFSGMMHYKLIKQGDKDIKYIDAWEIKDGKIKLKDNIDIRYSHQPTKHIVLSNDTVESIANKYNIPLDAVKRIITDNKIKNINEKIKAINEDYKEKQKQINENSDLDSTEKKVQLEKLKEAIDRRIEYNSTITINNSLFKAMRNKVHQVQNNLQGAYSRFDQPEAQRYLAFRFVSFLRRYFIPMFTNRFGFSGNFLEQRGRFNIALQDNPQGTYIMVLNSFLNTFRVDRGYLLSMTKEEKAAWLKTVVELGGLLAITLLAIPLLGYDDEDEDRFVKLRERSGILDIMPGSVADERYDFKTVGFIQNQLLSLAMQVRAENEQFLPLPRFGLDEYIGMLNVKSMATGPTVEIYQDMFQYALGHVTGSDDVYYKKGVGPYKWQQEGGSKFITRFWKMFGITGSTIDPVKYIQSTEAFRNYRR